MALELVYPNCTGLDVHKKFVIACWLKLNSDGTVQKEMRRFLTLTRDLEAMADWLAANGVTHVAMESTGVYWQPIYNLLEGRFDLWLVNAQSIKRMPGRKTDVKDAEWIATLMQHGLLQRSFIPERAQRQLRDLTRYRQSLLQERSRFANRIQKVLEDANLKLASVATDIQGVSAQAILQALLDGQSDPHRLAELAKGRMRAKKAELEQALVGRMNDHHRFLLRQLLTQVDFLDEQIAEVETQIEADLKQMPPFEAAIQHLDTIPGINRYLAIQILAEIGVDMQRFPSDRHLTAWAGMAPGNNETGGKSRSVKKRKGNQYVQSALAMAAQAGARSKDTYLRSLYHRLAARRGKPKAMVAVGRTILQMIYFMLSRQEDYHELGALYLDQLDRERTAKRLVKRLQALGFTVNVKEQSAAAISSGEASPPGLPLAG
jgi:transposase